MSNRRKPKVAVASYEARNPVVRLIQTAIPGLGNRQAVRREAEQLIEGMDREALVAAVTHLALAAGVFARRIPTRSLRDQLIYDLDNAEQQLAEAMSQVVRRSP